MVGSFTLMRSAGRSPQRSSSLRRLSATRVNLVQHFRKQRAKPGSVDQSRGYQGRSEIYDIVGMQHLHSGQRVSLGLRTTT
jgi:hypothetical protein